MEACSRASATRRLAAMPSCTACLAFMLLLSASALAQVITPACPRGQVWVQKKRSCQPCKGTQVKVPDTTEAVPATCKPGKGVCKSSQIAKNGICQNCPANQVPQNNDVRTCGPCPTGTQKTPKGAVAESTCRTVTPVCTPKPETCNGIDDDCDGIIDNKIANITCGTPGTPCFRSIFGCVNGAVPQCTAGQPVTEICNGIDDDCDGLVDEELGTVSCGEAGTCKVTVPACVNGKPNSCTPGTKGNETCNGLDDDCDGLIDEDLGTVSCGGPIGSWCYKTVQACSNGAPVPCVPNLPQNEICNGIDDNCNGLVDEGTIACGLPNSQCYKVVPACINGMNNICMPNLPSFEACDNIDNNCNGLIDEGYGILTCGLANSACFNTISSCVNGTLTTCTPKPPQAEVCNNFDDNCNGIIDDVPPVVCGTGSCGVILNGCTNGTATTCAGVQLPQNVFCQALTVTFDDLPNPSTGPGQLGGLPLPSPYTYFNWTNFNYYRGNAWPLVGNDANTTQTYLAYRAAVVSQPNAAKLANTTAPMAITTTSGNGFDFLEVTATGLWYDNTTVTFTPTGGSGAPQPRTFYLMRGLPTKLQLLGYNNITKVSIATAHPLCTAPLSCTANPWVLDVAFDNFVFQSVTNNPFGRH